MNNDENWENEIDWSKRTTMVGGTDFYDFVKTQAIPVLEDWMRHLAEEKAVCEDKMRRWKGITERSQKLAECFDALVADEDFMRMIDDFDTKTCEMFKGESIPTLGGWVRIGIRFTAAMRDGSSLPTKYSSEIASLARDAAMGTAVRDVLRSFVAASDNDYRLRCAPERFRTRVFRDLAQSVGELVAAGARIDFKAFPYYLQGIEKQLKVIVDFGARMQGICRRAKKSIKRSGSAFWARLDGWNALRLAV